MAYSAADLESIERAIANGRLTVSIDGHSVTYRSITDLRKAHEFITAQIAAQSGQRRAVHYFTPKGRRD